MNLFAAPETWPFGVALGLMLAIALVEGLGLLVAASPSHMLDNLLPEIDGDSGLDKLLGWLYMGRVPALVLLMLFLTGYAVIGYALQKLALGLFGAYLPVWLAGLLAVPAGLATVRGLGGLAARIIPRDESSAVSETTLIGRTGVVSGGTARRGLAAQARVLDSHGRTHFVMVEPEIDDQVFQQGAPILLVSKPGPFFRCIENPHPDLM
jgi:hypothetical protein